jgi:CRISPR-associated exonuclease Cas4
VTPEYSPDELLPLSGLQHFQFCRRQWALIHVERQWHENVLTAEGRIMHNRADQPFVMEIREGVVIARSVPVASYRLGLNGVCDVVEFVPSEDGVVLQGREGKFAPVPVEYKHGKPKSNPCDEVQLCAQAMCLEEMLSITIPRGFFFYGETRRRLKVEFSQDKRQLVEKIAGEMHEYFSRGYTPKVKKSKACASCSLVDICLPDILDGAETASRYIARCIEGE